MPIAQPDRTKGSIPKGLDGSKGAYRGYREGERRLIEVDKRKTDKGDEQLCAFPYRTPVGVMSKEGIASAVNGSLGAGMVGLGR
jgi:hypothetical protein